MRVCSKQAILCVRSSSSTPPLLHPSNLVFNNLIILLSSNSRTSLPVSIPPLSLLLHPKNGDKSHKVAKTTYYHHLQKTKKILAKPKRNTKKTRVVSLARSLRSEPLRSAPVRRMETRQLKGGSSLVVAVLDSRFNSDHRHGAV